MTALKDVIAKIWYERFDATGEPGFYPIGKFTGKTIVVIWDGNNRHVGVSQCAPAKGKRKADQFSRQKGRMVALNRAKFSQEIHGADAMLPKTLEHFVRRNLSKYYASFQLGAPLPAILTGTPEHLYFPLAPKQPKDEHEDHCGV